MTKFVGKPRSFFSFYEKRLLQKIKNLEEHTDSLRNELFETKAAWFYAETGVIAPGKDYPAGMPEPEDRFAVWKDWLKKRDYG